MCLHKTYKGIDYVYLLLYVDDMLLSSKFEMDLVEARIIRGMYIQRENVEGMVYLS